jgi:hypothetical protein
MTIRIDTPSSTRSTMSKFTSIFDVDPRPAKRKEADVIAVPVSVLMIGLLSLLLRKATFQV